MNQFTISVNNESTVVLAPCTLSSLLQQHLKDNVQSKSFAVAVNGEFVPKSRYDSVQLQHGDELDIVTPIGGG